ncbi:unnamed protein product [Durusdinium trenchii]|uniref:ABC transporter domain-containing protein n=1 Tax=Durusdinium trenchii TaxID=1381693 RepID=A0ABP0PEN7_9DINO
MRHATSRAWTIPDETRSGITRQMRRGWTTISGAYNWTSDLFKDEQSSEESPESSSASDSEEHFFKSSASSCNNCWEFRRHTALAREGERAYQLSLKGGPRPQRLPDGTWVPARFWGVHRRELRALYVQSSNDEMWQDDLDVTSFVNHFVRPQTEGTEMGYALMVHQDDPQEVNLMISHAWVENAKNFFEDVLQSMFHSEVAFICFLSNFQGTAQQIDAQLGNDILRSPFTQVINSAACQRLLVVPNEELRSNGQGLYSRLWCIWEIKVAADAGLPIMILPHRSSGEHLLGQSIVSSRNARCGNPHQPMNKDETLIREAIANMPPESNRSSAIAFFGICFCTSYGAVIGGGVAQGLREEAQETHVRPSIWTAVRPSRDTTRLPPKDLQPEGDVAKREATWRACRTVEGRLRDVRADLDSQPPSSLAADVDVALRLLADRRREACEAKAMAKARAGRPVSRAVPPEWDPALRMELRHQALAQRPRRARLAAPKPPAAGPRRGRSATAATAAAMSRVRPLRPVPRVQSREVDFKGKLYAFLVTLDDWKAPLNDGSFSPLPDELADQQDIVQFASAIFVANEGEAFTVSIMRLGRLEGEVRCNYRTEESSGKAGQRYEHVEGQLVFPSGVYEQRIEIPILESPLWSATLEFKVVLESPMGCQLGRYLKICRVKVIDQDSFPSSYYAEQIAENVEDVRQTGLFIEYVKHILEQPGNTWRFMITLLFDQLKNLYVWFTLTSSVYMVNVVFDHDEGRRSELLIPEDPAKTAQVIGLLYVLSPLLLHVWKVVRVNLDLNGRSKVYLQTSVMRKYMNFSDESREAVTQPELVNTVMKKTEDLAGGISEVSALLETLGKLVMLNSFAISSNPDMTWAVVTMPGVMLLWSVIRDSELICEAPPEPSKKLLTNFVADVSNSYQIIAHYFQRPTMNEKFAARAEKFNDDEIPERLYKMNSEFFFSWLGPLFVGLYMAFYSPLVLSKELPLGTFLATISVFKEVSSNFEDGYSGLKKVISCFEPLVDLTVFLNRKTDVPLLKSFVDYRVEETIQRRRQLMSLPQTSLDEADFRTDLIPIRLENIGLQLDHLDENNLFPDGQRHLFREINLTAAQGKLVAVKGPAGSGKSKLLRMLAGDASPSCGTVLIPSHLRFVFVTHQVFIMDTTPLQNLFFGDPDQVASAEERHRMLWILDKLQMHTTRQLAELEISMLQEPEELEEENGPCGCCYDIEEAPDPSERFMRPPDGSKLARQVQKRLAGWHNSLSFQEKAKLHMARALIMNPEILILEKPLMNVDERESENVMAVLREYVSNRGVAMPAEERDGRRPRTCFLSVERSTEILVDAIWEFKNGRCQEAPAQPKKGGAKAEAKGPPPALQGYPMTEVPEIEETKIAELQAEVEKAKKEVEREAQVIRELRQAEGLREQKAQMLEDLTGQLQQVHEEKAAACQERRKGAAAKLGWLLEVAWQRWRGTALWQAVRHIAEQAKSLQRKERVIARSQAVAALSSCLLLWRQVSASSRAERAAQQHLEELQRLQLRSAQAHAQLAQRQLRRSCLAWRLEVRQRQEDRKKAEMAQKATAFMASLPSSASSVAAPAPPVESDVAIGENDGAQAAQAKPRARAKSCPKILLDLEQRAEERRKSQAERRRRRNSQNPPEPEPTHPPHVPLTSAPAAPAAPESQLEGSEASAAATEGAEISVAPPAPATGPSTVPAAKARPRALIEMEKRALERRQAHELRRQQQKQKEEERRQKQAEEEQRQREAEEEAKREKIRMQRHQQREQQRLKAQKLVDAAVRRDKVHSSLVPR